MVERGEATCPRGHSWWVLSEDSSPGQFGPKWALAVLDAILPLVSSQDLRQLVS